MRKKEAAPRGGGFRKVVLVFGLEEDHATDLEQIPIVEVLVKVGTSAVAQINTEVKMLPPCVDVHGCGVDLLDHAHAPALHFRAGRKGRTGCARRVPERMPV